MLRSKEAATDFARPTTGSIFYGQEAGDPVVRDVCLPEGVKRPAGFQVGGPDVPASVQKGLIVPQGLTH